MEDKLITDVAQLTPARLTNILHNNGHLRRGAVENVRVTQERERIVSYTTFLEIQFSGDAAPALPARLLFKVTKPQVPMRGKEVLFYRQIAGSWVEMPVPRCFDAAYCEETRREYLLLEDLSATHGDGPQWPSAPTPEQAEQIVDALARMHAACWNDGRLIADNASKLTWEHISGSFEEDDEALARMIASMGEQLPPEHARLLRRVFAQYPRLYWERVCSKQNITLCHGDAHAWNFLYPLTPGGKMVLVDWQSWGLGVGAVDLAYFMGLWWDRERRQLQEMELLKRYHSRLCDAGVTAYGWDHLWYDYRLYCLFNLYFPEVFYRKKFGEEGMWRHLHHAIATIDDYHCRELLS